MGEYSQCKVSRQTCLKFSCWSSFICIIHLTISCVTGRMIPSSVVSIHLEEEVLSSCACFSECFLYFSFKYSLMWIMEARPSAPKWKTIPWRYIVICIGLPSSCSHEYLINPCKVKWFQYEELRMPCPRIFFTLVVRAVREVERQVQIPLSRRGIKPGSSRAWWVFSAQCYWWEKKVASLLPFLALANGMPCQNAYHTERSSQSVTDTIFIRKQIISPWTLKEIE